MQVSKHAPTDDFSLEAHMCAAKLAGLLQPHLKSPRMPKTTVVYF